MSKSVSEIQQAFRQLRLAETADGFPELLRKAEQTSWTYLEFIEQLTTLELRKREEKSIEKRLNWARFPYHKPIQMFQLEEQAAITERQLNQLREYEWLEQNYNLILLGPPGAGKTLLSVGLGIEAIHKGFQVYFVTMGELIQLLKTEEYVHKSKVQLKRLRASDLVIIDDVMYMALDQREATFFFQLIHQLYEQCSLILTSNRSPEEWTEIVGNQGMMTAILDRLLHRVEVIHMNNESHRLKHQQKIFKD
ncbi:IS21-like element helper ATPase IstB [Aureibacillus halotolerans]|uniref:DNA replication protein DnaC n=1 Tax=Aureibacillus halotolerans TaxID=1508390 RepID=A0A4R6TQJ4_9BACI|nr:IS21-like element helper ATPase IstB [Aureibacillus halotolerans]TDQ31887.1 DNA replication protein DnaC [Aureibacillus halotolerans]